MGTFHAPAPRAPAAVGGATQSIDQPVRPKRTRTFGQLDRKRAQDKVSQRSKRARQKAQTQQLELELREARVEIAHLLALTTDLRKRLVEAAEVDHPNDLQGSPVRLPPPLIGCRCTPRQHESYSACVEHTIFDNLMQIQPHPVNAASPPFPATPHLSDLLLMGEPTNPASRVLYKIMKRPNMDDLVIRSAVFIIAYRLLRYRLYPTLEAFRDIPEWLRPTDIQYDTPHPLYVDFMQFPQLRDAMALGIVNIDPFREEFDADFRCSLSVNWPRSRSIIVVNDSFDVVLNPDFEAHVCIFENWTLDSRFACKYPMLAPLVNIRP
ncbi:hypothetical protein F4678DRAFT_464375 [Xylaria arbuscula]|nr:hypothetical protein F4678DRAFT_464375 [Xylaria arbuscula]